MPTADSFAVSSPSMCSLRRRGSGSSRRRRSRSVTSLSSTVCTFARAHLATGRRPDKYSGAKTAAPSLVDGAGEAAPNPSADPVTPSPTPQRHHRTELHDQIREVRPAATMPRTAAPVRPPSATRQPGGRYCDTSSARFHRPGPSCPPAHPIGIMAAEETDARPRRPRTGADGSAAISVGLPTRLSPTARGSTTPRPPR